jgi:hypothetical protein
MRIRSMPGLIAIALSSLAPAAASADYITGIPFKTLANGSPISIVDNSLFSPGDGTVRACISFRNIAPKPATLVTFTFRFDDLLGNAIAEAILPRSGTFGTGTLIEGKMHSFSGGNPDMLNNCVKINGTSIAPAVWSADVRDVTFQDGTTWKKGDPIPGGNGGSNNGTSPPGNTTITEGGAVAVGGTIGGSSTLHGAIAWLPGSRTVFGVATDISTQDIADYTALSKCMALAPGNQGCTIQVRMSEGDKKCGAIATDDTHYSVSRGPDTNLTVKLALDALQKQGGELGANNIVTIACNK